MAVVISGDTGITSVNGTASAPSITGADTNTGIVYGTDTLSLATGGVAAVTIDSSQNVGIGTSSPANKFDVYDAASATSSVSGDGAVFNILARASSDSSGPQFSNQKFRGTIASPTVVASGDITGRWVCFGYDGTTLRATSEIRSVVDGTPGSSDMPGRLVFYTTPDGSGTSTERMRIDSSGIVTGTAGNLMLVSDTTKASTSGTSVEFTAIPSWVKRITVMLRGVSTNGTASFLLQLGTSGGFVTTGYVSQAVYLYANPAVYNTTSGFNLTGVNVAAENVSGQFILSTLGGNIWTGNGGFARSGGLYPQIGMGGVSLAGTVDRLRIIGSNTAAPADTFDAGSVNIMYE